MHREFCWHTICSERSRKLFYGVCMYGKFLVLVAAIGFAEFAGAQSIELGVGDQITIGGKTVTCSEVGGGNSGGSCRDKEATKSCEDTGRIEILSRPEDICHMVPVGIMGHRVYTLRYTEERRCRTFDGCGNFTGEYLEMGKWETGQWEKRENCLRFAERDIQ